MTNEVGEASENVEVVKSLMTPAGPTSFDTRKVGTMAEVEEDGSLGVKSSLTLVSYLGRRAWGRGAGLIEMPRFAVQRLRSQLKVKGGSPTLLGTISRPNEGEGRVWLVFLTVVESEE